VVKEAKIGPQIKEEIDQAKVETNSVEVSSSEAVEISLSSAFRKQSLLQKKFKIRLSKPLQDFKELSQVEVIKPKVDGISVLRGTEMSKWRERNQKSSR
jgi:hypothetical protein